MGIYDQFHGSCPWCGKQIGRKKGEEGFSGFQVKDWIVGGRTTTYDFYPGDKVPYLVDHVTNKPIVQEFFYSCYECRESVKISFEVKEVCEVAKTYEVRMREFERAD